MDELKSFLDTNINRIGSSEQHKLFREGVTGIDFLLRFGDFPYDPAFKSRFHWIRNLCLAYPEPFEICPELSKFERALMLLSFNNISDALSVLETDFSCEVTGTTAKTRTGAEISVGVLQCYNTASSEPVEYTAEGYTYENFVAQPLCYAELIYCYIKVIDILRNEDNETLKKFKLKAYLDRMLMKENELSPHFLRALYLVLAEVGPHTRELETIREVEIPIDNVLFEFPITFKFDLLIQLGLAYKSKRALGDAYECLQPYPLHIEIIDCLVGLGRSEEAADAINQFILRINTSTDREDRIILCDLYMKLAHLYQDTEYFNKAFQSFRSSKPLYLKALYYFTRKEFESAVSSFEEALQVSPRDEKIRFAYACGLIEVERIPDAMTVLKELKAEDPMNEKIARNLGYCHYKQSDVDNTLESLRSVALGDPSSMSQYFILSLKYKRVENLRWAIPKISNPDLLRRGVACLISNGIMTEAELAAAVRCNPYVEFDEIFKGAC